jgi:hypothetical protein
MAHLEIAKVESSRVKADTEILAVGRAGRLERRDVLVSGGPEGLVGDNGLGCAGEDGGLEVDEEGVVGSGVDEELLW